MRKVLITGGAGFIGSHLAKYMVKKGFEVIAIDSLITGSLSNINNDIEFIYHDITQPIDIDCNYIFHLASPASPKAFTKYPLEIMLTNSIGTLNMLMLAERNDASFLLASTSEVYGNPEKIPQNEKYYGNVNPIGIRSVYDEGKRFAEALTMVFHRYRNVDTKIARIFNTFGEGMQRNDGRVMTNFIMQALDNKPLTKPLTIYGDGNQVRSFCYVSDTVEGLYKLMFSDIHEPVNIGNPQPIKILKLALKIKNLLNSKSEISFEELPEDDPEIRIPDISLAKEKLGWYPKVSFERGLKQMIKSYLK